MPRKKKDETEEAVDQTAEATETSTDETAMEASAESAPPADHSLAEVDSPVVTDAAIAAEEAAPTEQAAPSVEAAPTETTEESASVEAQPTESAEAPAETAPAVEEAPQKPHKAAAPKTAKAKKKKSPEPAVETKKAPGKRAEKIGIISSDKMMKTVTVRVDRLVKHPVYRKYVKKRKKFMAHDDLGAKIGDKVKIVETRPLSARKRWRVVEIIQRAEN